MSVIAQFFVSLLVSFAVCHPINGQLVGQLNTFLSQPGWQYMDVSVKNISSKKAKRIKLFGKIVEEDQKAFIPATEILEDDLPGDHNNVITSGNLFAKYRNTLIVLQCKYAEVAMVHMSLVQTLIDTCRQELDTSVNAFLRCFQVMMTKAEFITVTFRYMKEALKFFVNVAPSAHATQALLLLKTLTALEGLTRYLSEDTKHKWNEYQCDKKKFVLAKRELDRILGNVVELTGKNSDFMTNYCLGSHRVFTPEFFTRDFAEKTSNLPAEETFLDYIGHKIDWYTGHVIKKWFYRLGFVYDFTDSPEEVTFNKDILS